MESLNAGLQGIDLILAVMALSLRRSWEFIFKISLEYLDLTFLLESQTVRGHEPDVATVGAMLALRLPTELVDRGVLEEGAKSDDNDAAMLANVLLLKHFPESFDLRRFCELAEKCGSCRRKSDLVELTSCLPTEFWRVCFEHKGFDAEMLLGLLESFGEDIDVLIWPLALKIPPSQLKLGALLRFIKSPSSSVHDLARLLILKIPTESIDPDTLREYMEDENDDTRELAWELILRSDRHSLDLTTLLELQRSPHVDVCKWAVILIFQLPPDQIDPDVLFKYLVDSDKDVREIASALFLLIPSERLNLDKWSELQDSENPNIQDLALRILFAHAPEKIKPEALGASLGPTKKGDKQAQPVEIPSLEGIMAKIKSGDWAQIVEGIRLLERFYPDKLAEVIGL